MKKSFKKIISAVLIAVLILSVSPVGALTEFDFSSLFSVKTAALTSGNYTYEVSGTNATITGYSGSETNLTIPSTLDGKTVVAIERGVFKDNTTLKSVSLPSTLTRIGVDWNGDGVFARCSRLETVTFAKGTNDAVIGFNTFLGCPALKKVEIPGNYVAIQNSAFESCTALTSFKWEKSDASKQYIGEFTFKNCTALASVSLPVTLNSIGKYAFQNCAITNLVIPEGVTTIEYGAFLDNGKLKTVSLPSTLTRIGVDWNGDGVFARCSRLETVTFAKGTNDAVIGFNTFLGCPALKKVEIPGNYVAIQNSAFESCTALTSFKWEKSDASKQYIGEFTFKNCTALASVSLPVTLNSIGKYAFQNCAITNLVIPEGVTTIEYGAFLDNGKLKTVSLPSTLTKIGVDWNGDGVFARCAKLETVTFAKGTADAVIGFNTFKDCYALKSISIPGNYVAIQNSAFENCESMTTMIYEKSDYAFANQYIGEFTFKNCPALANVSLPVTLNSIGKYAFQNCGIINLVIPEGVTAIDYGAFLDNGKLKTVSLPSTLTRIGVDWNGDGVFARCSKLETVTFAKGTADAVIGFNTFKDCYALKSISIPGNYVAIQNSAFENCESMTTMIYEKSDYAFANQYIGEFTFKNCPALANVSLPVTLNSIGKYAFQNCGIINLVIPEGVTTIEYGAFLDNGKLMSVSLPSTLTRIGVDWNSDGAFARCAMLETVIFAEGEDDFAIGRNTFRSCPALATVHLPLNLVNIFVDAFNGSTENLTICSKSNNSYGKAFATENSIDFKLCDGSHTPEPGPGDVSGDGKVNSNDALLVLQYATGLISLTEEQMERANVNGDKNINSGDALMILQFSTGLIKEF